MVTEDGEYLILETPTSVGWNTRNIHTKERKNLDLVKDMASMKFIGKLCSQTEEGFNVINYDEQLVFVEKRAYKKRSLLQHRSIIKKEAHSSRTSQNQGIVSWHV